MVRKSLIRIRNAVAADQGLTNYECPQSSLSENLVAGLIASLERPLERSSA
jgi:hypothetical protein